MLYADDLALICETWERPKERLEAWKGALESIGLTVNVKKTKTMTSSENTGKVSEEDKFPSAFSRKERKQLFRPLPVL